MQDTIDDLDDDEGKGADGAEAPKPGEKEAKAAADATAAWKDVAGGIKDLIKQNRELATKPDPKPSGPTLEEYQEKATKLVVETKAKAAEFMKAGDYEAAIDTVLGLQNEVNKLAPKADLADNPVIKAGIATARREAKRENPEIFETYAAEVEAAVSKLSVEDRINPDAWDRAIREVKLDHLDDIADAREKRRKDATNDGIDLDTLRRGAPTSGGSNRVRSRGVQTIELDEDAKDAARQLGFTDKEYAAEVALTEAARIRKGKARDMVPILSDERPKPGRF